MVTRQVQKYYLNTFWLYGSFQLIPLFRRFCFVHDATHKRINFILKPMHSR